MLLPLNLSMLYVCCRLFVLLPKAFRDRIESMTEAHINTRGHLQQEPVTYAKAADSMGAGANRNPVPIHWLNHLGDGKYEYDDIQHFEGRKAWKAAIICRMTKTHYENGNTGVAFFISDVILNEEEEQACWDFTPSAINNNDHILKPCIHEVPQLPISKKRFCDSNDMNLDPVKKIEKKRK
eukprot:GHVU01016904.1.p2 GENE.GHVU01016904.1~~GHVU01016904.1.p2  ORF type:complete len:181 (-),score=15.38 GHVU01016904.1:4088-4630(-)